MNSQDYLYQIGLYLSWFEAQVGIENGTNYFDINKHAERFLIPILNEVFDGKFERLEYQAINYPAVDVGERAKRIGVQVTSETGYGKITRTLDAFLSNGKYEDFDQLFHIIIDKDYKTSKKQADIDKHIFEKITELKLDPAPNITFDLKDNIWNISNLKSEIEQRCSTEQLAKIAAHLKAEYGKATDLPSFHDLLVPYKTAFDSQLDTSNQDLSYQLHNDFFGRDKKIEEIEEFAASETDKVLVLVADGGYGKTRLCVEYFQRYVDGNDERKAFVLVPANFDAAAFAEGLSTGKKTFVLFDDAHTDPKLLNQIIPIINRHENAKVILTIRNSAYRDVINSIASHQRKHEKIQLARLEYEETKALFKSQLPGFKTETIVGLTNRSNGVPIVILAMADALRKGISSGELTEDESFTEYVLNLKTQAIDLVAEKTYIDKEKINKTIQVLSLLAPVIDNEAEITQVGQLNQMSYEETEVIIETLNEIGFIERKSYSISVKPDPYSDVILLDSAPRIKIWLKNPESGDFKERIVKNIMLIEHSEKVRVIIQGIISDFVSHLVVQAKNDNQKKLHQGLDTLLTFTYKKPDIALSALEHILPAISELKQPEPDDFWTPGYVKEVNEDIDKIFSIALLNSHGYSALHKGFDLMLRYAAIRKEPNKLLMSAFKYRVYDFYEFRYRPQKDCERQEFLVRELENRAKAEILTDTDQELIIDGLNLLLKLDFNLETFYEAYTGQFSYGVANVPQNNTIREIRKRSLSVMLSIYPKLDDTRKKRAIDEISSILHYLRVPKDTNETKYDQTEEIKTIIPFLIDSVEKNELVEQRGALMRKLDIFNRHGGIKAEFEDEYKALIAAINKADTPMEKFQLFLDHDYFYVKEHSVGKIQELLHELGGEEAFFKLLLEIRRTSTTDRLQNLHELTSVMIKFLPDAAINFLNFLIANGIQEAADFSHLVKANSKDLDDFYQKIDYFWNLGDVASKSTATWMLIYGRNGDKSLLKETDFDYFETILAEQNQVAIDNLKYGIDDYLSVAPGRTLELIGKLFKIDNGEPYYQSVFYSLFEDKEAVTANSDAIKDFLFANTIDIPLDHYFQEPLKFLEDYFGFDALVDYLSQKVAYFKANSGLPGLYYDFVFNNLSVDQEKKEYNFIQLLDNFIKGLRQDTEGIIDVLKPASGVSEYAYKLLLEKVDGNRADKAYIIELAKLLHIFEGPTESHLKILLEIGNLLASDHSANEEEIRSIFPDGFYYNMGSRSKSGPGAFPQDLEKKKRIEKLLAENSIDDKLRSMFTEILAAVERDIEEENRRNDW